MTCVVVSRCYYTVQHLAKHANIILKKLMALSKFAIYLDFTVLPTAR